MDALALLCNLYGDGPATLKRLRVGGVLRIEDLSEKPVADLAVILELEPATARRFLKEATTLRKRVLEAEDSAPHVPAPRSKPLPARRVVRGKEAILDAASRRWDELEQASNLAPASAPVQETPKPIERAPATALEAGGFDQATRGALESAGVQSLEELAASDSDSLAQAAGLGLSQVLYAQSLARRILRESSPRPVAATENLAVHILRPPARIDARFSPSEEPPAPWRAPSADAVLDAKAKFADEAAGPFA